MDIWKWVVDLDQELIHQGHYRLAYLIRLIPHHTVEENHTELDAIVPEALALARAIKNTWLEVFIRHWHLQSRAAHRYEVTEMLPEAVNLLEFSHRQETRDCPQSVCVVQDIDICYGLADGPGYVEERLAVAKETLAKIDASWACFTCISGEYASALLDDEQVEETLAFLEQQAQTLLLANRHYLRFSMRGAWVETLIRLQRYDEAYAFNQESYPHNGGGEASKIEKDIDKARITALLGRYEESKSALPNFDKIIKTLQHCLHWAEAVRLLVNADMMANDWQLNVKFQQMIDQLSQHGVIRQAFRITLWQAELALKRGHPNTATRCYHRAQALIPRLRKPLDAPQLLADMRNQIDEQMPLFLKQISIRTNWEQPEQVTVAELDDPETRLDILEQARKRWPTDENLLISTAKAYHQLGESQSGLEILHQYLEPFPDSPQVLYQYGQLLFEQGQYETLQQFAQTQLKRDLTEKVQYYCHLLLVSVYEKKGEFESATPHLHALLEIEPNDLSTRMRLAKMERQTGHLKEALKHLDWLVEYEQPHQLNNHYDWERMVVATLLEDWDTARQSAKRLGFKNITGEELGGCHIQFREADGESVIYSAIKTGPVTAKIVEISEPYRVQHYQDIVVFEPVKLNDSQEADEHQSSLYAALKVIQKGGYSNTYVLDGVHPGEENLTKLKKALDSLGCQYQLKSDQNYQLHLDEDSEPLPGMYAYLAVPENQPLQEVADLLANQTENYAHPLIWPEILEKLGDEERVKWQRLIEEEYGL
jgi:tetratricopeptide (TPR) repeat protein